MGDLTDVPSTTNGTKKPTKIRIMDFLYLIGEPVHIERARWSVWDPVQKKLVEKRHEYYPKPDRPVPPRLFPNDKRLFETDLSVYIAAKNRERKRRRKPSAPKTASITEEVDEEGDRHGIFFDDDNDYIPRQMDDDDYIPRQMDDDYQYLPDADHYIPDNAIRTYAQQLGHFENDINQRRWAGVPGLNDSSGSIQCYILCDFNRDTNEIVENELVVLTFQQLYASPGILAKSVVFGCSKCKLEHDLDSFSPTLFRTFASDYDCYDKRSLPCHHIQAFIGFKNGMVYINPNSLPEFLNNKINTAVDLKQLLQYWENNVLEITMTLEHSRLCLIYDSKIFTFVSAIKDERGKLKCRKCHRANNMYCSHTRKYAVGNEGVNVPGDPLNGARQQKGGKVFKEMPINPLKPLTKELSHFIGTFSTFFLPRFNHSRSAFNLTV
jgi:hypothetical protein